MSSLLLIFLKNISFNYINENNEKNENKMNESLSIVITFDSVVVRCATIIIIYFILYVRIQGENASRTIP